MLRSLVPVTFVESPPPLPAATASETALPWLPGLGVGRSLSTPQPRSPPPNASPSIFNKKRAASDGHGGVCGDGGPVVSGNAERSLPETVPPHPLDAGSDSDGSAGPGIAGLLHSSPAPRAPPPRTLSPHLKVGRHRVNGAADSAELSVDDCPAADGPVGPASAVAAAMPANWGQPTATSYLSGLASMHIAPRAFASQLGLPIAQEPPSAGAEASAAAAATQGTRSSASISAWTEHLEPVYRGGASREASDSALVESQARAAAEVPLPVLRPIPIWPCKPLPTLPLLPSFRDFRLGQTYCDTFLSTSNDVCGSASRIVASPVWGAMCSAVRLSRVPDGELGSAVMAASASDMTLVFGAMATAAAAAAAAAPATAPPYDSGLLARGGGFGESNSYCAAACLFPANRRPGSYHRAYSLAPVLGPGRGLEQRPAHSS